MHPQSFALRRFICFALAAIVALPLAARASECGELRNAQNALAHGGMVVAQEACAAWIGADILAKGGNAVDAAVAVGFALAVSYPRAGNIGGGGFMVIHLADGQDTTIDYRETAPRGIDAKSFLDDSGNADPRNRANPRLPSACRAQSRAWRSPSKNMARENSRSPN
jgi:gamma-glutamyltranspeptidase/glutathione hydrolase